MAICMLIAQDAYYVHTYYGWYYKIILIKTIVLFYLKETLIGILKIRIDIANEVT